MDSTPRILYEDNHLLVALKQPNLLTQGDSTGDPNLLDILKAYLKEKYEKPGDVYLGLVHRMDRPVGGVLCFARTSKAAARLSRQLKDKQLRRDYVAVCQGQPMDRFTLRDFLEKDETTNMVTVVPSYLRRGKEAILHGRHIASAASTSLVAIQLETGRAHQIRAQLSAAGWPIAGDHRYGQARGHSAIALWGMRLSLKHPVSGESLVFIAPPPMDGFFAPYQRDIDGLAAIWPVVAPGE